MSDRPKVPCQATPFSELRRQMMDSNVPKNEREWWAYSRICALEYEIEGLKRQPCSLGATGPTMQAPLPIVTSPTQERVKVPRRGDFEIGLAVMRTMALLIGICGVAGAIAGNPFPHQSMGGLIQFCVGSIFLFLGILPERR